MPYGMLSAAVLGTSLILATQAPAQSMHLKAVSNPETESTFTLDFGALGRSTAGITTTNFDLAVSSTERTASFVDYFQEIDPIELPGGFSTGNIVVEIVPGSSFGEFDPVTGEFNTEEMFAIFFEGDLSAFGIESPVLLPSSSSGNVVFLPGRFGEIEMDWFGDGALLDPLDPNATINFSYVCKVSTVFGPDLAAAELVNLYTAVARIDTDDDTRGRLNTALNKANGLLMRDDVIGAATSLTSFLRMAKASRGTVLTEDDADALITNAMEVLAGLIQDLDEGRSGRSIGRTR